MKDLGLSTAEYDVVVVGSGAAGMVGAIRVHDLGLRSIVVEKAHQFGGTSALSGGGLWIPGHHLEGKSEDTQDAALIYLKAATEGLVSDERLAAYVAQAPAALKYLSSLEIPLYTHPRPDYLHELAGSAWGRCVVAGNVSGKILGEELLRQREPSFVFRLFNRYSLDLVQALALSRRPKGWQWTVFKMLTQYWLDLPWRFRSNRDRHLTMGAALVAGLRKAMIDRDIPLLLNTRLTRLDRDGGSVRSAIFERDGREFRLDASHAVLLACGGFEHNQTLRDRHHRIKTSALTTVTPAGANSGDGIGAGEGVGAATEFMEHAWWFPVVHFPSLSEQNLDLPYLLAEYRHPHSILVNRLGRRFTNEFNSYDRIGLAMIDDQIKTGANAPCWMIFDSQFRRYARCGPILPSLVMPDFMVPSIWWDSYIYKAPSLPELAPKLGLAPEALAQCIAQYNDACEKGQDLEFGRGSSDYDRCFGAGTRLMPNSCLGALVTPPFYAVRVNLGDLGTKGGLKVDARSRVLDTYGQPIPGLYAAGNTAGSLFAGSYPGAGGTLGAAITGAFVAANDVAEHTLGSDNEAPIIWPEIERLGISRARN